MRLVASAFVLGTVCLAVAACDGVVQEPVSGHPEPLTTVPPSASSAPARCVKRWTDKPQREPFVAGFVAPDCPEKGDADTPPAPKDPLRNATVVFPEANAGGTPPSITVEVAESGNARQRGLMMRKSMPENRGMIFVFEERTDHAFWMHNTCIPLDMMYIDKDGLIVGIQENVPTMSDSTFSVGCSSTYVLEVNAGWSRKHGIAPGQKVKLDGV